MVKKYGKNKAKSVSYRSINTKGILIKELEALGVKEIDGIELHAIQDHVLATKIAILREVM